MRTAIATATIVTMSACPIEVEALRCTYGDHVAVDGLDLTVAPGEVFALLGTNGAGKTTAMETLEGRRRPAAAASGCSAPIPPATAG
jgi:ABC-type multidrug transport system ATPase subunit